MNSLYLIILLFLLVYSRRTWKELYNPVFLFVGFWTALLILSSFNLFNQNPVQQHTYMCVVIGVVSFAFGGIISSAFKNNSKRKVNNYDIQLPNLPSFVYKLSVAVCIVLFIYLLRTMQLLLSGTTLDYIRTNFTTLIIHSDFERLLWSFIVFPMGLASMSTNLYAYFIEKKKTFLVLSLVLTTFLALTSGGRVFFFFYLLQVIYFAIVSGRALGMKNVVLVSILVFVSYHIVNYISASRQIETSTTESLYVYFTGCFPFMESKMSQLDAMGFNSYGLAFLNAPLTFIEMILKNIGLMDYSPLLMQTNEFINGFQEYENIGSANFNAFVSAFFAFYMDGGIYGIVIESFLFGCLSLFIFEKTIYNKSPLFIVLYAIILNVIFTSFVRWQLGRLEFFLSFFYVWLFLRSRLNHDFLIK